MVVEDRRLQYHKDPHHYSNWCKVCGKYYCWHKEAKEFDVNEIYSHDMQNHKFIPREEE